jgi:hypothetical protein
MQVNILGLEITSKGGAVNWMNVRRFFYVAIVTWLVGVRLIGLNPFDDKSIGLDTILDGLALYAVWLIVWHMLWSLRPKFS